jgi:hypothetical protein
VVQPQNFSEPYLSHLALGVSTALECIFVIGGGDLGCAAVGKPNEECVLVVDVTCDSDCKSILGADETHP